MEFKSVSSTPRVSIAELDSRTSFLDGLMERFLDSVKVTLPCKVMEYDRETHVATLKVIVNSKLLDGQIIEGCEISQITLRRLCAGGFLIDFPINVGDTGWLIATDRDATLAKEISDSALVASPFNNSYSSGLFIPDAWGSDSKLGISGVPDGKLTIQTKDGSQQIAIGSDGIEISATTLSITADSTTIQGPLSVTGGITGANGITLEGHTHTDSMGGTTTPPISSTGG